MSTATNRRHINRRYDPLTHRWWCSLCRRFKPRDAFCGRKAQPPGWCRVCANAKARDYNRRKPRVRSEAQRERDRIASREWYAAHPELARQKRQAYRATPRGRWAMAKSAATAGLKKAKRETTRQRQIHALALCEAQIARIREGDE